MEKNVSFVLAYDPKQILLKATEKPYTIVATDQVVPYGSYALLVLDYFAVYVPQIWLERFHYLKNIIHNQEKGWSQSETFYQTGNLKVIDITQDLHQCFYKTDDMVDFSVFPDSVFCLFQGHSSSFTTIKQRRVIRFLMPFIEFLAPSTFEVEYWRKKSQSHYLMADLDM